MSDEKPCATLSDRQARGGVIGGKGYGFQAAYIVSRIPIWLDDPDFAQFLQEGAGDVDVRFNRADGEERWYVQVKNHEVKMAEARDVLAQFRDIDAGSSDTFSRFILACPWLHDNLKRLRVAIEEWRELEQFYEHGQEILDNTWVDLESLVHKLELPVDAAFLVSKLHFDTDLPDLTDGSSLRRSFVESLRDLGTWGGLTREQASHACEKVGLLCHRAIRQTCSREEVEALIREALGLKLSDLCPYKGLAAFTEADAEFFFGRKRLVSDLVDHLRGSPRFLAVIGSSGSGKSSVVQAGLFPALCRGEVPGSADWQLLTFRPGADPFGALVDAGLDVPQEDDLQAAARDFLEAYPQVKRLVLFADQFEELFALCSEPVEERFLSQLLAVLESNLRVTVVLALRADFYGHLLHHQPLVDWLNEGQVNVAPMGQEELRTAVEEPALKVSLRFEPGLVETIVEEAGTAEHPLPLLESALTQLWEKQENGVLTHAAYQAVGRVAGAIGQWAEDTYSGSAPREQSLARRVFTRLVHYGEGEAADTRQRQALSELAPQPEEQETLHRLVQRLADARLLVTGGDPGAEWVEIIHDALLQEWGRLRRWLTEQREFYLWRQRLDERLQEWEQTGRDEGALLHGALLSKAKRWLSGQPGELNPGESEYIQQSMALLERREAELETRRQHELARARALAEAQERRAEAELQRAETQTILTQRVRRILVALAAVFLLALGIAVFAGLKQQGEQKARQEEQRVRITAQAEASKRATAEAGVLVAQSTAQAEARKRATVEAGALGALATAEASAKVPFSQELAAAAMSNVDENPELSLLLAMKAVEAYHTFEAENALRQVLCASHVRATLRGHEDWVLSAKFSPDGRHIVTASDDGTARVWDAATGQEVSTLTGHEIPVNSAAFSPDGQWVVTAGGDDTARVWDAATGQEVSVLRRHERGWVESAAFSPDGQRVVTAGGDDTARVWDAATGRELTVLRGHTDYLRSAVFSPDGQWIATTSNDDTARVWNADTGHKVSILSGHEDWVLSATFSPDGRHIVTASDDGTARVWDAATGQEVVVLSGHKLAVNSAEFSCDGRHIVTASDDGTAQVWEANTGSEVSTLRGHAIRTDFLGVTGGRVASAVFDPAGQRVLTAGGDGTARVWEADTGQELIVLQGHTSGIESAVFSPDGRWALTASLDNTARIWDLNPQETIAVFRGHERTMWLRGVNSVAYSPDGQYIVTAGEDGTARIGEAATGHEVAVLRGHETVGSAGFSPDGQWVVTTGSHGLDGLDTTVRLWKVATGQLLATLGKHSNGITAASFSPDGRWVLSASFDGTARIWETATGRELAVLRGHERGPGQPVAGVLSAAFSPDGQRVVTGGMDQTARIWDAVTGQEMARVQHEGQVMAVAFSPSGELVASGSADGTVRVWDPQTGQQAGRMEHKDAVTAIAFSPDGRRLVTAGVDGASRIWETATGWELAVLREHEGIVRSAVFSPDGRWVATAGDDATARVWDAITGRAVSVLRGHEGIVRSAVFSPDGRWVATAGDDATARIYIVRIEDLLEAAQQRVTRELTCQERVLFLHEALDCGTEQP